jgi:hypothetical protein
MSFLKKCQTLFGPIATTMINITNRGSSPSICTIDHSFAKLSLPTQPYLQKK